MSRIFATFSEQHREIRLDMTTGLSRDITKRFRAGEFDIIVVKEVTPSADYRAIFSEAIGWFEGENTVGKWQDPIPLVAFPVGGLYRETMFERLEHEQRHWYVAFTGSSLNSVLTAVEAGLGLSLIPADATSDYGVRLNSDLGMEPAMLVSIYAWEKTGKVAELVDLMAGVLAKRYKTPDQK
jgi:DNA-binding transcriptional LysR family regulator